MGSLGTSTSHSRLFQPLKLSHVELKHRVAMAPLTRYRNNDENTPLDFVKKYYSDRASTPGTLLISEATSVSREEEGIVNGPGLGTDDQFNSWKEVIAAVHAQGSFIFQQIWGMGRAATPEYLKERGYPYKSSSAVRMEGSSQTPEEMTEEDILRTIQDFATTAKRAIEAGADGVEIHGAHGYLVDQFTSDSVNHRTDRWGGSTENRARFAIEVVKAVGAAIGTERVGLRLSPFAIFQGAEASDIVGQYSYLIEELKKLDKPLAYLHLIEARGDPGAWIPGSKKVDENQSLDFILDIWNNRSPVIIAGGYRPESALKAVETHYEKWDVLIAFGRHFISNPDLVFRIRKGIELSSYDRATFYANKQWKGYNDYPFSEEFLRAVKAKEEGVVRQLYSS